MISDNNMVCQRNIHNLARLGHPAGNIEIFSAGSRISTGMIM